MIDDYDPPSADPQIMKDYQAALGAFLVSFNALENELGDLLLTAVTKLGAPGLAERCSEANMDQKISYLEFLKLTADGKGIADIEVGVLRDLNKKRNDLAHGHVDQNPFDGSFKQVGVRKGRINQPISIKELHSLYDRCDAAYDRMRRAALWHHFDPIEDDE